MPGFEPGLGDIMISPLNFAPRGWAFCHGQLLNISQNTALFALLGTNYGGDGRSTFALPDLRGRVVVGAGQGPGDLYLLATRGGAESYTLNVTQLAPGSNDPVTVAAPTNPEIPLLQPYLALNYIIAMEGIFPARW